MSRPHLFNDVDWSSVEQTQKDRMCNELTCLPSSRVLGNSIEDLCDYFEATYRIEVPVLLKEQIVADQQERDIDVTHDQDRYWSTPGPHYIRGTEISITVPFSGAAELFKVRLTRFAFSRPCGEIKGGCLILRVSGVTLDANAVRTQLDQTLAEIESYLSDLRKNVEIYNQTLKPQARQQLEARREKLLRDQNLVAALGFPLGERERMPRTYAPPEVKRRIKPSLPPQSTQPFTPEPALTSDEYEHILVLENMALVMEQSPSAFNSIDEESLRSHFLVQLNGHYQGQATGETFNYSGKTDILLRVQGRNIFIGECKYWSGAKKLSETLDQLLSYSSWRDTKVALIIFNRRKNFSAVLQEITPAIEKHPNYKRTLPVSGESRFRFVLSHKDDPAREMIVTVLAFDVPSEESKTTNI
jgi:hypothetical protein